MGEEEREKRTEIEAFYIQFGLRVMELRRRKKFSREYLADKAGISPRFLFDIEWGKKGCSAYVFRALADSLGVAADSLIHKNGKSYH